jgi:CubicO group peptidase (beta-lactamase class C family)
MKEISYHIEKRVLRAIRERVFPGCVVGLVDRSFSCHVLPFGKFGYEDDSPMVREHTVYDVASITKAIPVSSLALKLLESGKLNLTDQVTRYVPALNNPDRERVLIWHLLTQTLHFGYPLSTLKNLSPEAILRKLCETPLESRPGEVFSYSNATSILLGMVLERIYGEALDAAADRFLFGPLRMEESTFHPLEKFRRNDIVPTEVDTWRGGVVQGEVHDESAWALKRPVGSAGLFSTAPDLLTFLCMLLNHGSWKGASVFSEETIQNIVTNQISHLGLHTGLGWELNQPRYMGKNCSNRCIGKTGFTGCVIICDLNRGRGMVLLSNCTFPRRAKNKEHINSVRRDVADIVFE